MNPLDLLIVAYVGFSVWYGRKRGFAVELPRLVSLTLALIAGGGLFHWIEKLLVTANHMTLNTGGPIGFIGITLTTFFLVWHFRRRIGAWALRELPDPDRQRRWGMVTGGCRGFALCALLLVLLGAVPVGEFRKPFTRGSFFGRIVHRVVRPAYQAAHQ